MKAQILLILIGCLSSCGFARGQNSSSDNVKTEKKNIYVLGTFHFREHNFEKYPQDINSEIKKAIRYKPDIVCVEWIDKSEELDLYNENYSSNIKHLIETEKIDTTDIQHIIDNIYLQLAKNPHDINSRSKLANYLYVTRDYINACYQWYLIGDEVKDSTKLKILLPNDINTYRKSLYGDPRNQKREIVDIAFPIAASLSLPKIHAIDYRHDESEYSQHINAFSDRFYKQYGYDPMQRKSEPLQKLFINLLETDRLSKQSTYIEKLNSKEFEKSIFNYYYDMYLSFAYDPDYRIWHELQLEKRNWKIFELLARAIQESKARKTFVLVGATHKYYLERYLNETNMFSVANYKDVK